jgi:hypothetical protein
MRIVLIIFLLLFVATSSSLASSEKLCTKEDAYQAESDTDHLKSWGDVYSSFKRYSHCNLDDGGVAEGYSDKISLLLANDWGNIAKLNKLCESDKKFEQFIYRHLDMTIPADTWEIMVNNATKKCPSGAKRICNMILKANDDIEQEIKQERIKD